MYVCIYVSVYVCVCVRGCIRTPLEISTRNFRRWLGDFQALVVGGVASIGRGHGQSVPKNSLPPIFFSDIDTKLLVGGGFSGGGRRLGGDSGGLGGPKTKI